MAVTKWVPKEYHNVTLKLHSNRIYLLLLPLLAGCTINGSFQGLRSYYPKSFKEKPELFVHSAGATAFCEDPLHYQNKVAIINASELRSCMTEPINIIYLWQPNCTGSACISLNASQHIADSVGADLFVIAKYYDVEMMDLNHAIRHPILGINTKFYGSDWTDRYLKAFLEDLLRKKTEIGIFILFEQGEFSGRFRRMEDLTAAIRK